MKNIARLMFVALLIVGATIPGKAHVYVGDSGNRGSDGLKQTTAGCSPSSAFEWLNINNVRTRINAGGDMWWDLSKDGGSQYYIPANGSATSLFAGALWIAGLDINNQLKCAAVRFRQGPNLDGGNDFWTGPLTLTGASIDEVTCAQWDQIFKITRAEVDEFLNYCTKPLDNAKYGAFDSERAAADGYSIPKIINEWPAHPEKVYSAGGGISHYMAPFYDNDKDGEYNPMQGDFPYYDIENELCHTKTPTMDEQYEGSMHGSILADQVLKGDQTLWWVFNDKGNQHTETQGDQIGLEIRAQAFAFATNDEINNMSFCSYEIINRSTYVLTGTYFCPWTDVDLGYAGDDYVGCDVSRGLGYGYNGTNTDGSGEPQAYGNQPPAVGIDFFQGPYMDPDGVDNPKYTYEYDYDQFIGFNAAGDSLFAVKDSTQICDVSINGVNFGNGIVDDERFGMRRFLYHNNDNSTVGDPKLAADYYLMLQGIWKDGNKMMYGGNAYPSPTATNVVGPACDFMFPGDTDPCNWGTGGNPPGGGYNTNGKYWTDSEAGNQPADRRFMQSAGPFTLQPGAVNYITFGVPWARATSGGALASVELLRVTDDKCQALFDNCFKVIDGPSAPDLTIRELDQQLIIYLSNSAISNNYREGYVELDPEIPEYRPDDSTQKSDRYYRFEGYKVYQLVNNEVGADELDNNDKARLIFQCDIKNGVSKLVNYEYDDHIGAIVPALKVEGGDAGITHSFVVTNDMFSNAENPALVNHKSYYFMAVAYGYNNYMTYSQDPSIASGLYGQQKPYLEGRKNIQCYSAVPHKIVNGTVLRSDYGQKPAIQRLVGVGNGGNVLELSDEDVATLFTKKLANSTDEYGNQVVLGHPDYPIIYHPQYKVGYGPLNVKIIDPLNVKNLNYELALDTMWEQYTYNVSSNKEMKLPDSVWVAQHPGQQVPKEKYYPGSKAARMVSNWILKDANTGDVIGTSDVNTSYGDEKLFIENGLSITVTQSYNFGPVNVGYLWDNDNNKFVAAAEVLSENSGLLFTSMTFQDSTKKWLDGIRDCDNPPTSSLNWIRAGKYYDKEHLAYCDFNMKSRQTAYDPNEAFEKIANGTWAPYFLCAYKDKSVFPIPNENSVLNHAKRYYDRLSSVDIVMTADKSKWTRCPVIEMCRDEKLSENGALTYMLRKSPSVDKDGNPYIDPTTGKPFSNWEYDTAAIYHSDNPDDANFIAPQGMGWFPGYVIDIESGARLNVVFGEDSYLADLNGRDMLLNPPMLRKTTVDFGNTFQTSDPAIYRSVDGEEVFGARHYVYIFGMDNPTDATGLPIPAKDYRSPAYDGGKYAFNILFQLQYHKPNDVKVLGSYFWRDVQYIGMPMGVEGTTWLEPGNDAKIRIRINRPYAKGYASVELDSVYDGLDINNQYPMYKFDITGLDPLMNDDEKTESDLDLITVVPNPYYAYSSYEKNALNNKVKITNLPNNCTVTIYNLSGTKIRQFKKDNEDASIDWDLTNFASTPVASGFYLIHVKDNVSGGERTVKFFGAMRLIDLNTF